MKFGFTKLRIIVLIAGILGCSLVVWKHEGILKRISNQRAEAHLKKAIASGEENDWKRSEQLSLAAWQLKEGDPNILRQLYLSAKELRSQHLLYAAGALFDHPEASREDRIDVVFLHLQIGDMVGTRKLLQSLSEEELQTPEAMEAGVRFFLARDDILRALPLVEKLQQTRGSLTDTMLAARVLARVPTEGDKATSRAQSMIQELFFQQDDDLVALAAFPILRTMSKELWETERFANAKERIRSLQEKGNDIPVDHHFLVAEIEMAANPTDRAAIIDEIYNEYAQTATAPLASWLLQIGETKRVEQLLADSNVKHSPELFLVHTQFLLQQKNWAAAQKLLANPQPQIPHPVVHAMRATVATGLGQNANSREQWERALRQATLLSGRSGLFQLARLAASAGAEDIRNRALTEALRRPSVIPMPATDVRFLFSYLATEDDPENLLMISRNLLRSEPDNPLLVNNVLWLEMVMKKSSGTVGSKQIQELVDRFPGMSTLRATLTLALLNEEKPGEARAAADAMISTGDPEAFSATDRAVLALVHREFSDSINWSSMMEVERSYFMEALAAPEANL